MQTPTPNWLLWARKIQAIAQIGLTYAEIEYDRERYRALHDLALDILAAHTGEDRATVGGWFAAQGGYATPKVDVRGAVFERDTLLLVRERSDDRWCLPGGWADVGDVPSEAAEREVREEAGVEAKARKVVGVFDANRDGGEPLSAYHGYKLIFLCERSGGAPQPNHETLEARFFGRDEIPPLSEARTNPRHIELCFAHRADPARPTDFD